MQPFQGREILRSIPRVGARRANPGLVDKNPFGIMQNLAQDKMKHVVNCGAKRLSFPAESGNERTLNRKMAVFDKVCDEVCDEGIRQSVIEIDSF